jgi:predicted acyl esterase
MYACAINPPPLLLGQTALAERGFAVVVQDTRGRFGSDGTCV